MARPAHRRAFLLACGLAAWVGGCSDGLQDPLIEALLPARGAPGVLVDVVGERFASTRGAVHFGGRQAKVLIWTPQRLRVQVPDAGLVGWTLVVVTAGGRPSNAAGFYVEGQPRPDAAVPDVGPIPDLPWVDGPLADSAPDAGADTGADAGPDLAPDLPASDLPADTAAPDLVVTETFAPDAPVPDAVAPDLVAPDLGATETFAPDAPVPDAAAPDAAAPDAAAPDAAAVPDGAPAETTPAG